MTKIKKSLHTEPGHSTPDRITERGRDLPSEILGHLDLGDMAFLELAGCIPASQESVAFSAIAAEFGFPWKIIRGFGVMARAIGLVGYIREETEDLIGVEIRQRVEKEAGGPRQD